MAKLHLTPTGQARKCTAEAGNCRYGENGIDPDHYETREEAQAAYEKLQGGSFATPRFKKGERDFNQEMEELRELAKNASPEERKRINGKIRALGIHAKRQRTEAYNAEKTNARTDQLAEQYFDHNIAPTYGKLEPETIQHLKNKYVKDIQANPTAQKELYEMEAMIKTQQKDSVAKKEEQDQIVGEYFDKHVASNHSLSTKRQLALARQRFIDETEDGSTIQKKILKAMNYGQNDTSSHVDVTRSKIVVGGQDVRAGDIITGQKFTDSGQWVEDNAKVVKVDTYIGLNGRESVVTYENGSQATYNSETPINVYRDNTIKGGKPLSELSTTLSKGYREAKKNGILSKESVTTTLQSLNNPNADIFMAAKAEKIADILQDNNQHRASMKFSSAAERIKLAYDSNYKIEDPISVMYDDNTPDDLRQKLAQEYPDKAKIADNVRQMEKDGVYGS